ncbi:cytosolic phospholipase A2 zeta-like, partial [Clarias magur]
LDYLHFSQQPRNPVQQLQMEKELASYWNLSVTVLRGQFEHTYDNLSEPELYVTLNLPTASNYCSVRTKTINNCKTPEWNETFQFCVSSLAKNVLETALYDRDPEHKKEDKIYSSIMLDINTLNLGQKETKEFIMDGKLMDKLWLEFELTESPEGPVEHHSNGVLLTGPTPFWNLSVTVLRGTFEHIYDYFSDPDLYVTLHLPTASDCCTVRTKTITDCKTPEWNETFHFRVFSLITNILEIQLYDSDLVVDEKSTKIQLDISTLKLGQKETKEFITDDKLMDKLWLELELTESPEKDIKVRLDFDIPAEEKEFLVKRREVVSRALQTFLNLDTPLDPTKVPTVAVVCSGGGSRSMTGTFGSLKGLQSLGLLDVITYITSVSGSTWTTASLYSDPVWSMDEGLDKAIASAQKELSKSPGSLFSLGCLLHYARELRKRVREGHPFSLIDLWGLIIEQLVFGKKQTGTLSDQKMAVSDGQNPLPIYTAVNMKEGAGGGFQPEWCEFTPFEVGFDKYGAFVNTENFGSEFCLGYMIKNLPETRIPFLLGIWSSVFSANLIQLWKNYVGQIPADMLDWLGDSVHILETDNISGNLDTVRINPELSEAKKILNFRPFVSSVYNFLKGYSLHNMYRVSPGFNTTNDKHPDAFPNTLTPADFTLGLVDSGLGINIGCPPVLRPNRRADVILCLENSWAADHLATLKETQQYCSDHKLPFPNIDFTKYTSEPTSEVYVFEDEENPDAPIVICFPLVNISFKEYKAP